MQIHDAHVHIIQSPNLFGEEITFTWDDFNQYMNHVDRVLLMPSFENNSNSQIANQNFFQTLQKNPFRDRVWAYYWPHAHEVYPDFLKMFDVAGIKYHPSISQLEVHKATAVLDLAEDNELPLLVHCGRNEKSRIDHVLTAYKKRNITITAAHLGGVSPPLVSEALLFLEDKLKKNSDLENFYLDTASIDNPRLIVRAINVVGPRNIIFGTDTPFHDLNVLRYAIQQVWEREDVNVTAIGMRAIMCENIERIHRKIVK